MFRKIFFKTAAALQLGTILEHIKKPEHKLTVLCFHRISSEFDSFWQPVYPETFKLLLEELGKNYTFTTFSNADELLNQSEKPLIILSFDDGYKDFIEEAFPILNHFEIPSNHNIVSDCAEGKTIIWTQKLNFLFGKLKYSGKYHHRITLNEHIRIDVKQPYKNWLMLNSRVLFQLFKLKKEEREFCIENFEKYFSSEKMEYPYKMMNWDDVRLISENNVEIGSHSISHDSLPSVQSENQLDDEVVKSKSILEEKTGKPCTIFSIPNGQTTDLINDKIKNAGYKHILDLRSGGNNVFNQKLPTLINRLNINPEPLPMMRLRMALFNKGIN